ncbi:MAG: hypothetical protein KDG55_13420 [Rhodocyclaceae bacterium]|nr:hypothetical protein [Rhodocyclaceae bacterium]
MCKKVGLSSNAPEFKPAAQGNGAWYDGTDYGALNPEYFYVEAPTERFRTILPHGHITCDMHNQVANISYTFRDGRKIASVLTAEHWLSIQADSPPIYRLMGRVVGIA